jgi:hypothetical protein
MFLNSGKNLSFIDKMKTEVGNLQIILNSEDQSVSFWFFLQLLIFVFLIETIFPHVVENVLLMLKIFYYFHQTNITTPCILNILKIQGNIFND